MFQNLFQHAVFYFRTACEIGIIAVVIYSALFFMRGTRSATILAGITIFMAVITFLSRALGLGVIEWILTKMWAFLAFSVLIIFQPEIRRALAELGSQQPILLARTPSRKEREIIEIISKSAFFLADHRIGALFVMEQDIGMRAIAETGTPIDAPLTQELLTTFFFPNTPLHDGGVIIRGDKIAAAGCIFPLTDDREMSRSLGTRHRAGVGVTEETDAIAIIVSEETGSVSLAYKGRLVRGVDEARLARHLRNYMTKRRPVRVRPLAALHTVPVDPDDAEEDSI